MKKGMTGNPLFAVTSNNQPTPNTPETKKRGRPPKQKEDVVPTNSAPKRRGRPPKENKQEEIVETVKSSTKEQPTTKPDKEISYDQYKKQDRKSRKKESENTEKQPKKQYRTEKDTSFKSKGPDKGWKDIKKSTPNTLTPLEFYVDTGKEKRDIFRGYLRAVGEMVTDEPYKMVVLRRKYDNLYYKEITGCSLSECPNEFPSCEDCKNKKKRLI